jgi:LPXTG-motif cell wall-anchored protein
MTYGFGNAADDAPEPSSAAETADAIRAATSLLQTAGPLIQPLLQAFITTAQTLGLGAAMAILPPNVRSQLGMQMSKGKKPPGAKPPTHTQARGAKETNWPLLIGSGVGLGALAFFILRKKRK